MAIKTNKYIDYTNKTKVARKMGLFEHEYTNFNFLSRSKICIYFERLCTAFQKSLVSYHIDITSRSFPSWEDISRLFGP